MVDASLQAPNRFIPDRSAINAMQEDWIAKNGEPRKFERGFSSDWGFLQNLMARYGFKLSYHGRRFYSMHEADFRGVAKRISRDELMERIDAVLVENGKQPFGWRKA